jgi:hypothetical protein
MSAIGKLYDLKSTFCLIGGIQIGGYGADGGLVFEQSAPIGEITHGADGETVFSRNNNNDISCVITVLQTSRAYRDLGLLMKAQELTPFVLLPYPFIMRDATTGDQVSAATAIFVERPNIEKGRTVSEATFRVHLPNASIGALYGLSN